MSKQNNKIWIGWLAFLFIIVHFCLIVFYALPEQISNAKLKSFSTPYVEPVFTQTWGMFAPCPVVNSVVDIQFFFGADSTDWVNPVDNAAAMHGYLKGSHHGELVLSASNLYYWLSVDLDQMDVEIGDEFPTDRMNEFYEGYSYFKIHNFIRGNGLYLYDSQVDSANVRFHLEDVVTKEKGTVVLPKFYFN